jgi:hypothetical protein
MIEPIPDADEADVAEQTRPVDDDVDGWDAVPDELGDDHNADAGDALDQRLAIAADDDDHPPASARAWEFDSPTTRRSFIDDVASRYEPARPDW